MALDHVLDSILPKFRVKPKNIKQLMLPMIISGWVVGRGVVELPLGKRRPVASCVYSLFTILAYSFVAKVTADDLDIVIPAASSMGIWIINPIIWMDECVMIGSVVNGWKSIKNVKEIIKGLEASDKKAEKIAGVPRDYGNLYRRQLFTLVAELVFTISIMLYAFICIPANVQSLWHTLANTVCIYYPLIVVSIGDNQFITLVRSIALGFERLNVSLEKLSTTTKHSPQHQRVLDFEKTRGRKICGAFEKRTKDDSRVMRAALQDHYELVRIATLTNATFGTQTFLSMALSSICLLGLLYRCSALLLWSTLSVDLLDKELGVILGWVAYYIYRIIAMTSACTKALDECKKTATIICQLHEPSTKKAFRDEISDFLLQMTQNTIEFEFTACGLFTLDRSFIQQIIVTISTYLVILVQLDGNSKSTVSTNSTSMTKNI